MAKPTINQQLLQFLHDQMEKDVYRKYRFVLNGMLDDDANSRKRDFLCAVYIALESAGLEAEEIFERFLPLAQGYVNLEYTEHVYKIATMRVNELLVSGKPEDLMLAHTILDRVALMGDQEHIARAERMGMPNIPARDINIPSDGVLLNAINGVVKYGHIDWTDTEAVTTAQMDDYPVADPHKEWYGWQRSFRFDRVKKYLSLKKAVEKYLERKNAKIEAKV